MTERLIKGRDGGGCPPILLLFVVNSAFWRLDEDDDDAGCGGGGDDDVDKSVAERRAGSPVSKLVLMAEATTGLHSIASLTDLSKQACDLFVSEETAHLYMPVFFVCAFRVCFESRGATKAEPYVCRLFLCHTEEERSM